MSLNTKTILIFIDWYYPSFKAGGPITSIVNLVKVLRNEYKFYIVTGDRDLGSTTPLKGIKPDQWVLGESNERVLYLKNAHLSQNRFDLIIEETGAKILFVNSLFSLNFSIKPLYYSRKKDFQVFLSPRGMLHPQAFSQKGFKKRVFVRLLRSLPFFGKVSFLATDKKEKKYVKDHSFKNKVFIVPNIPDLTHLTSPGKAHFSNRLLIISRIAEEKNSLFALDSIANIKQNLIVHWVGEGNDPSYVKLFNSTSRTLPRHIEFIHHGSQSKDQINLLLKDCSFFFLPTLGENFGHAIFEALSAGCPVVIGENTPFRDVEKNNVGYLADLKSAKNTASILEKLMSEPNESLVQKSKNAKELATEIANPSKAIKAYKHIW